MIHPIFDLFQGRDFTDQFFGFVDFKDLRRQILRFTGGKFHDRIDPGGFQQFGIFPCDSFDSEKIRMVGPFEDQFFRDAGLLGEFIATFFVRSELQ